MSGYLQIYCISSEYEGRWGNNPFFDLFYIYNIVVDKSKMGAIVSDCKKLFPIESGAHQISINLLPWRSSVPLDVEIQDNITIPLVCGMDRTGKLFIERDLPSSAVLQRMEEEALKNNRNSDWRFSRTLGAIIILLLVVLINLEINVNFQFGGGQWILAEILSCSSILLLAIGISWIYRIINQTSKKDKT